METITMKMIHLEKLQALDFRSNEAYKTLRTNIQFCGCNIKQFALQALYQMKENQIYPSIWLFPLQKLAGGLCL